MCVKIINDDKNSIELARRFVVRTRANLLGPRAGPLSCSLVRRLSLRRRLRWVDDPRGMSRSTPSMTARLFFYLFLFIACCAAAAAPMRYSFVTGPGRMSGLPRASCLAACSVMIVAVIGAPMYNNIIIIITRWYTYHYIVIAIGVCAVVLRAGGAFLIPAICCIPNTHLYNSQ